ncbi:methyl-accepting chemotaxis protein [Candidatus Sodalis pierantonius]|uniref:methyl-accepting chemotaxis protein n=1 Tax=Candidatus Sodalis pierantonii TaxID=1486991 RepID=UPI00046CC6E9|nr:methyl-accepting chemotaxis protein [Candidatus Sodalis pierantonius]
MLNRMRVVNVILIALVCYGLIQIISGGLFYSVQTQDRHHFNVYQNLHNQQAQLSASWVAILQARDGFNQARISVLNGASPEDLRRQTTAALEALGNAQKTFSRFAAMVQSDKTTPDNFATLQSAFTRLHEQLKQAAISLRDSSDDTVDGAYRQYLNGNDRQFSQAVVQTCHIIYRSVAIMLGIFLCVVAVGVVLWLAISRVLMTPLHRIIEHIQRIAAGDLTERLAIDSHNEMGTLAHNVRQMQQSLIDTVRAVRGSADGIYSGTGDIVAGNNDLSARTEQQASVLEETAASMEQLTATVKQNADNARQAKQLAMNASDTARHGGKVVDNVVHTMQDIAGSSQKIADITGVIDGIAFQTNILALNAAVEAARAGEQGRGFAVVAGEVRNLAQRSAQAAKEIKTLIDDSVSRVEEGSVLVESAGETMQEIVTAVTRVTDIMGEISSASDEQSRGIDQVGQAVIDIDRATSQNAAMVQQSAAAAVNLQQQAERLTHAVSVFHLETAAALSADNWESF